MRSIPVLLAGFALVAISPAKDSREDVARRLAAADTVFQEVMAIRDKSIPQDLLDKASCVVVVPGLKKGAFIVGAKYGKGFFSCRKKQGDGWGAPAAIRVEGGSVGFQIGGSESDVIMLVMNDRGAKRLLSSKFTLGGAGEVAAGPVGRSTSAQTDGFMTAEILSWSRSRGAFAGISLQGATLRQDLDDNEQMYGKPYTNQQIVESDVAVPPTAAALIKTLNKYSARKSG